MVRCHCIQGPCGTERLVQTFSHDRDVNRISPLQLRNGQLVSVPPILVRRLKSHFVSLPCGVDLILGLNGYIWVSKHVKQNEQEGEEGFDAEAVYSNQNDVSLRARC